MENIIELKQGDKSFNITWSFAILREADKEMLFSFLCEDELKTAEKFPHLAKSIEFATGRYCAKRAYALYYSGTKVQNIAISVGSWGYPYIQGSDVYISIAHTKNAAIAVCTNGAFPIGVDMEDFKASNDDLILTQLSSAEKRLIKLFTSDSEGLHILWAAKEAIAKALRTGFRLPMIFFEISNVVQKNHRWEINFSTIDVLSVIVVNTRSGVLALAIPTNCTIAKGLENFIM